MLWIRYWVFVSLYMTWNGYSVNMAAKPFVSYFFIPTASVKTHYLFPLRTLSTYQLLVVLQIMVVIIWTKRAWFTSYHLGSFRSHALVMDGKFGLEPNLGRLCHWRVSSDQCWSGPSLIKECSTIRSYEISSRYYVGCIWRSILTYCKYYGNWH